MLDVGGPLGIIMIGFWIYCVIDVLVSDAARVRTLPKWIWLVVVVVLFVLGGVLWWLLGRPPKAFTGGHPGDTPSPPRSRPVPVRRARPASRAERVEDEAGIRARIAERDRLLAQWAEEDRRKRAGTDPAAGPPPDTGRGGDRRP